MYNGGTRYKMVKKKLHVHADYIQASFLGAVLGLQIKQAVNYEY